MTAELLSFLPCLLIVVIAIVTPILFIIIRRRKETTVALGNPYEEAIHQIRTQMNTAVEQPIFASEEDQLTEPQEISNFDVFLNCAGGWDSMASGEKIYVNNVFRTFA